MLRCGSEFVNDNHLHFDFGGGSTLRIQESWEITQRDADLPFTGSDASNDVAVRSMLNVLGNAVGSSFN